MDDDWWLGSGIYEGPVDPVTKVPLFYATADLILTNGIIYTEDASNTKAEAVAIKDGKILAVGSTADIEKYKGEATQRS